MNKINLIIESLNKINEGDKTYTVFGVKCGDVIYEDELSQIYKNIEKNVSDYMVKNKDIAASTKCYDRKSSRMYKELSYRFYLYFKYSSFDYIKKNLNKIEKSLYDLADCHPKVEVSLRGPYEDIYQEDKIARVLVLLMFKYQPDDENDD